MSTPKPESKELELALASVPKVFRDRLIKFYVGLKQAFVGGDYDACGSRSGKFCETLIRFIQHALEGTHTTFGVQINIYDETRRLEGLPKTVGPEPFRVFIPRALCFLYTLRNKRGFAHVGGDLDSERVDAATCVRVADWCLCELIRVVHNLSLEEAQALIESLVAKEVPLIWSVAGKKRILKTGLDYKNQVLLLLYAETTGSALIEDLFEWTEYSRMNDFKRHVIGPLHSKRLVEWDRSTDAVLISPTGISEVQRNLASYLTT